MQYKKTLASATLAATALAAYVPPEPWSTLTPSGTCPGGLTDYTSTFGITVEPITTMGSKAKRAAISQIGDGQIQAATVTVDTTVTTVTKNGGTVTTIVNAPTRAAISQITDGQIQAPAGNHPTAAAVSQITDGQIQAPAGSKPTTAAPAPAANHPTAAAVSQITDGQIQAPAGAKPTAAAPAPAAPKPNGAAPISQITDGQIQAPAGSKPTAAAPAPAANHPTAAAVSQITDGQIQAPTKPVTAAPAAAHPTANAVSQITDGQIQATHPVSVGAVSQIHDGQAQASGTSPVPTGKPVTLTSCKSDGTLELVIKGGVLTDAKGRIGSIVSNRQFQFDGPPPQAGAIYAKGWSISPEGNLALGSSDVFYQCLSGNFYNLYDQDIGHQCSPVHLAAIDLVNC